MDNPKHCNYVIYIRLSVISPVREQLGDKVGGDGEKYN